MIDGKSDFTKSKEIYHQIVNIRHAHLHLSSQWRISPLTQRALRIHFCAVELLWVAK